MGIIIGVALLFILALVAFSIPKFVNREEVIVPKFVTRLAGSILLGIGLLVGAQGFFSYNNAGYCTYVQTIWGSENAKCDIGWYVKGWGLTTSYTHFITIAHTFDKDAEGSRISDPKTVIMADQWSGTVTETTRFGIPQDREQFVSMHNEFRSMERLITSTLLPAVEASLDSTANLYTMEEYWAGGKRDAFKTDFRNAVSLGRPVVKRVEVTLTGASLDRDTAPSDSVVAADTAITGSAERTRIITEPVVDSSGNIIREPNDFARHGITVSSAIITALDPDDVFETQISKRKEAAARRSIAVEKRLEEEEQRLFAIAEGERKIAERQAAARTEQIEATTDAETKKRLALIESEKIYGQAEIAKRTSQVNLDKARIDAEAVQVTADADAYARQALLEADNALKLKLDTEIEIQRVWAEAYARRSVPSVVFAGSGENADIPVGGDSEVTRFLNILTVDAAKRLAYDRSVEK